MSNGDELYSATAVYYTNNFSGDLQIDYSESEEMKYFAVDDLPSSLTPTDKGFIEEFINKELV